MSIAMPLAETSVVCKKIICPSTLEALYIGGHSESTLESAVDKRGKSVVRFLTLLEEALYR